MNMSLTHVERASHTQRQTDDTTTSYAYDYLVFRIVFTSAAVSVVVCCLHIWICVMTSLSEAGELYGKLIYESTKCSANTVVRCERVNGAREWDASAMRQ